MFALRLVIGNKVSVVLGFAVITIIWTCASVFFFGMNKNERDSIISYINIKVHRK